MYLFLWITLAQGAMGNHSEDWVYSGKYPTLLACQTAARSLNKEKAYRCIDVHTGESK